MEEDHGDKMAAAEALREGVARVRVRRAAARCDPALAQDRLLVRAWQADRLARTYPDLLAHPRYGPAASFFLSDLYGPKDFAARDDAVARIVPALTRMLPARALDTLAAAVELDALSEDLDLALAAQLRRGARAGHPLEITADAYAAAYRTGRRADRERQIALVGRIGAALDRLARKPMLAAAIRLMEAPAHAAGLGAIHDFLARGFAAFRHMGGADEFLATIARRETELNERLFAGVAEPFAA